MLQYINVFSLHYFLWFAALTFIYGYFSVYAKTYANVPASQYGVLNMVLPFVTIIAKLFFCSLADRHRSYRAFFIIFLITATLGFGSFAALPFVIHKPLEHEGIVVWNWVFICIMTSVAVISMGVISCLSDAFAMNASKKNNTSYGLIRVWGTIGWAVSSVVVMFINDFGRLPLVPGLLVMSILLLLDVVVNLLWPYKDDYKLDESAAMIDVEEIVMASKRNETNQGDNSCKVRIVGNNQGASNHSESSGIAIQWFLFQEVARNRRSLFRYMALFTVSGALISLQWSYFFLYLEKIHETNFSMVTGLSMMGQAVLGELPFFVLSKLVVQLLGRSNTLSISIASIGLRYYLYRYLLPGSSIYYVLLTEMLQGPNFGLFYVVMTEVGLEYSDCEQAIVTAVEKGYVKNNHHEIRKLRLALCTTMQSLMSACYEGLGLGIGSIIGGIVIDYGGYEVLWFWAATMALIFGLINFLVDVFKPSILMDKKENSTNTNTSAVLEIGA